MVRGEAHSNFYGITNYKAGLWPRNSRFKSEYP